MCTVSLVYTNKGKMVLTSSRDERMARLTHVPALFEFDGIKIISPIDAEQKGTWIGASEMGRIACLLNGAESNSSLKEWYPISRGIVLKKAFGYPSVNDFILDQNLSEVAPFTLILAEPFSENYITELQWDGNGKSVKHHLLNIAKLWSSTTLYEEDERKRKDDHFQRWILAESEITAEKIFNFHQKEFDIRNHASKKEVDENFGTVSITQVIFHEMGVEMRYRDLLQNSNHRVALPLIKNTANA